MNILKTIASKIGMDKSIAYSSGANKLRAFTEVWLQSILLACA